MYCDFGLKGENIVTTAGIVAGERRTTAHRGGRGAGNLTLRDDEPTPATHSAVV